MRDFRALNKGKVPPFREVIVGPKCDNKASPDPLSWRSADRGSDRSILSEKENGL